MKSKQIKQAIQTLRDGDLIITPHESRGDLKVMVISRNNGSGQFEFTPPAPEIVLLRDSAGPFQWDSNRLAFFNKAAEFHRFISKDSRVVNNGAIKELEWYESLPTASDAQFSITERDLAAGMSSELLSKFTGLLNRTILGKESDRLTEMQVMIQFALGDTEISELQMKKLIMAMKNMELIGKHSQSPLEGVGAFGMLAALREFMGGEMEGDGSLAGLFREIREHGEPGARRRHAATHG